MPVPQYGTTQIEINRALGPGSRTPRTFAPSTQAHPAVALALSDFGDREQTDPLPGGRPL